MQHCFFSRKNGVSKGLYESLNCGIGSGDKKENVLKNIELVSKKIGCQKEFLITQLRENLEASSRKMMLEADAEEATRLQEKLNKVPLPIYIG